MDLRTITPVILTFDEEPNIGRTLSALGWAGDVVVVDSFSGDRTVEIASAHPGVRVVQRRFDSHAGQWNFAVRGCDVLTEWILALDADYVLTPAFVEELRALPDSPGVAGYQTRFVYCVDGHRLRGSVYPPVTTLFRKARGSYRQDGHTQRLELDGPVGVLEAPILHDDRKSLSRWVSAQSRYMELEASKLAGTPSSSLNLPDRIRKWIVVAPVLVFFYSLLWKGTILDGRAGLYYSLQRAAAETILSLHLLRRKLAP